MKVEETYLDVLQNIESAIANEYGNNASLKDRDVLEAIQELVRQYAAEERRQRSIPSVYLSPPSHAVFESVKEVCDLRLGRLEHNAMEPVGLGELLACLKRIRSSIQYWTKRNGSRGYLNYMTPFVSLVEEGL